MNMVKKGNFRYVGKHKRYKAHLEYLEDDVDGIERYMFGSTTRLHKKDKGSNLIDSII